jgi:acyl-CoA thioesterase
MIVEPSTVSPAALLAAPAEGRFDLPQNLWGFGGLHGGLALAFLTNAMHARVPGARLRGVTGQFHRPLREPFAVDVAVVRSGRTLRSLRATAVARDTAHVSATATFSEPVGRPSSDIALPAPSAPPPEECEPFFIPTEFVPFGRHTEIRPVGPDRPFAGCDEPELTAWLRFVGDDTPVDTARLVALMDSLAPSYAALLTTPVVIPTIELSVWPAAGVVAASSPWILLRARTRSASEEWIDEQLDAWAPDGTYLGSGHQLRLVAGRPS